MAVRWTDDALDAELGRRLEAQDRIADALVELDRHPGHRLLAGAALTGTSAQRWAEAAELQPRLWADLAVYRATVAAARAARGRRSRPGEREWAEVRRLLVEPSVETSRTPVALRDRGIAGPREEVRTTTLGELAAEMDAAFRTLAEVVEAAAAVHLAALAGLGPLAERLRAARSRATALLAPADPDVAALADLTAAVDARLAACAHDPLAHTGQDAAALAGDLDTRLAAVEARLAAREAVRDAWARERDAVAGAVAGLDALCAQEARARCAAQAAVADTGLAAPVDPRPALRRRLAALPGPAARPGPEALAALSGLAADVAAAERAMRAATERATGLTDRRVELKARFAAYRAKAARLGVAEEPEVHALAQRVRSLLDGGPADLRVLTPALVAYQRRVSAEEGRS